MNTYWQQDEDLGDGCTNDLQRAYAFNRVAQDWRGDVGLVDALVSAGAFVVVDLHPAYCQSTDAILGESVSLVLVCLTREEADAVCADVASVRIAWDESNVQVWPRVAASWVPLVWEDGEVPF